jgi:transcriptional regulator of met regulon
MQWLSQSPWRSERTKNPNLCVLYGNSISLKTLEITLRERTRRERSNWIKEKNHDVWW